MKQPAHKVDKEALKKAIENKKKILTGDKTVLK
jgi:hypothetical protein